MKQIDAPAAAMASGAFFVGARSAAPRA